MRRFLIVALLLVVATIPSTRYARRAYRTAFSEFALYQVALLPVRLPHWTVLMAADTLAVNCVRVDGVAYNKYGLCNRVCPMNRDLILGCGECINCRKCLEPCRKDAIYYGKK